MLDFSVFDSILDLVFIVDGEGRIAYCNDTAATFCQTSVRRVSGKAFLADLLTLGEPMLLPFDARSPGRNAPTPFIETAFSVPKSERRGKIQLAVRPMGDDLHWGFFIKDVSLEETLAIKYRAELAKTEAYARNLEQLVAARTAELNALNQTLNAILNSLGQGFFTFDAAGDCGAVFTKVCEDVLEGTPKGRKAWDVLAMGGGAPRAEFQQWTQSLFNEVLAFEDLAPLGPNLFPHSQKKRVALEYFPIRPTGREIKEVVVVATDQSAEYAAQVALEDERQFAGMVIKFTKNKEQFLSFLSAARANIEALRLKARGSLNQADVRECLRLLHTVEGEAGAFSLRDLRQHSRAAQHALEPAKADPVVSAPIQAAFAEALAQMDLGFERFLAGNQELFKLPREGATAVTEVSRDDLGAFALALEALPNGQALAADFKRRFLRIAIEDRLKYFDGVMQTVAERLGKRVRPLVVEGGETRIFPQPYQNLFSALVHAFRNAVDHGLEAPLEREWSGKNPEGQVSVKIALVAGRLKLTIGDDGKGIDPAVIRAKLPQKFPDRDFSAASDEDVIQAVCLPGFSSRENVGEFSGRGVGLDALREEVLRLGGTFRVKSQVGVGTTLELDLPEFDSEVPRLRSA